MRNTLATQEGRLILDDESAISTYTDFRARYSAVEEPSEAAAYPNWDGGTFDIDGMAFSMMANEQVVAIANTVNAYLMYLRQLKGWALLLEDLDEEAGRPILIDFVQPLAYFCLDAPYRIKQRLCASTARLSHQANSRKVNGWSDKVSLVNPKFDDAKRHAKHWDEWAPLEQCLANLNSSAFCESVDDFRNEFHHGFPRRVATGHTSFVERTVTDAGVSYAFGSKPPLPLETVVEALESQFAAALASYKAYVRLVETQRAMMLVDG